MEYNANTRVYMDVNSDYLEIKILSCILYGKYSFYW